VQEVPATINVVSADQMEKLNFRTFTDVQQLVPGLSLEGGGSYLTTATVRGVQFNPVASGTNPTVEFYLNDTPIASNFLFNSTFDLGQFELLRGPQGTLRGRASPSGSITLTTKAPNLEEAGFVVNGTAADSKSYKADVAINVPLIKDVLALRVAGVTDYSNGQMIQSIKEGVDPYSPSPYRYTHAGRASLRFEPTDFLSVNLMYQALSNKNISYSQVESGNFVPGYVPATNAGVSET
ncbi:MAG TPA: TonB-dependent receptor plug domain-containing protein, partial [Sphingobium sp.]|uniref:TonB-dependent receptor plug domain-containing protein n=1 Tax=Sphingobium sp. TaxID=1912891 RepID=UPI002ED199E8